MTSHTSSQYADLMTCAVRHSCGGLDQPRFLILFRRHGRDEALMLHSVSAMSRVYDLLCFQKADVSGTNPGAIFQVVVAETGKMFTSSINSIVHSKLS